MDIECTPSPAVDEEDLRLQGEPTHSGPVAGIVQMRGGQQPLGIIAQADALAIPA